MITRATAWKRSRSSGDICSCMPDEDAAGPIDKMRFDAGGDQSDDVFLQLLPIAVVIFVPDHQVDGEPLEPPIRMRLHQLAYQFDVLAIVDLHQHDRQITRDCVAPETGLTTPISNQSTCGRDATMRWRKSRSSRAGHRAANRLLSR